MTTGGTAAGVSEGVDGGVAQPVASAATTANAACQRQRATGQQNDCMVVIVSCARRDMTAYDGNMCDLGDRRT